MILNFANCTFHHVPFLYTYLVNFSPIILFILLSFIFSSDGEIGSVLLIPITITHSNPFAKKTRMPRILVAKTLMKIKIWLIPMLEIKETPIMVMMMMKRTTVVILFLINCRVLTKTLFTKHLKIKGIYSEFVKDLPICVTSCAIFD